MKKLMLFIMLICLSISVFAVENRTGFYLNSNEQLIFNGSAIYGRNSTNSKFGINIFGLDSTYDLDVSGDAGSGTITNAETFAIQGAGTVSTAMAGNTLTITGTATDGANYTKIQNWTMDNCPSGQYMTGKWQNGTLNCSTVSATVTTFIHPLNSSNHTGNLSASKVVKNTGTNFLTQLLDTILDALFSRDFQINSTVNSIGNWSDDSLKYLNESDTKSRYINISFTNITYDAELAYINNCSVSNSCSLITYDSELAYINNCSVSGSCSNIAYDTEIINNCSVSNSCGLITYDTELAYINNCSVSQSCDNIIYTDDKLGNSTEELQDTLFPTIIKNSDLINITYDDTNNLLYVGLNNSWLEYNSSALMLKVNGTLGFVLYKD